LRSLETDEYGQPAAFSQILDELTSGQSGQLLITDNARRPEYHDGILTWSPVDSSHYYYAPVTGKHFAPQATRHLVCTAQVKSASS